MMVIRPTGINHLREVSSWGPTYPPPIPPPPAFLHLNATLLHLSLFALPPFSLSSVTLWNIGTRSSKWILYQLSSSSPLFSRVIVARSLRSWTLSGCKNETKGLYGSFTVNPDDWNDRRIHQLDADRDSSVSSFSFLSSFSPLIHLAFFSSFS